MRKKPDIDKALIALEKDVEQEIKSNMKLIISIQFQYSMLKATLFTKISRRPDVKSILSTTIMLILTSIMTNMTLGEENIPILIHSIKGIIQHIQMS